MRHRARQFHPRVQFYVWAEVPGASREVVLTEEQAAGFTNATADAVIGEALGVSGQTYRRWLDREGRPQCRGITRTGEPCAKGVGPSLQDLESFVAKDRRVLCSVHRRIRDRANVTQLHGTEALADRPTKPR